MQFSFGGGAIFGVRTDVANPTPVQLGILQDISIEFSGDMKELYGTSQFPVAIARGKTKITGKAKFAKLNGAAFNSLYFGQTLATGQTLAAVGEAGTVPAITPWKITVSNGTTWVADLGVVYALSGIPLTLVAAAPTLGQYSVAAGGQYTFSTADASALVQISYTYTVTTGTTISIGNPQMGAVPTWRAAFTSTFNGKSLTLGLNACVSSKLSLPTKQDDWVINELDFQALADASGNVGTLSLAE